MNIPDYCPACLNDDCIEHIDLGDETDSDGTFGNHRLVCTKCGRRTDDMDTLEDAIEVWEERDDTVHFRGSEQVLMNIEDIIELVKSGKVPTVRELQDKDIRNVFNTGY